jgi:hypothetical protein
MMKTNKKLTSKLTKIKYNNDRENGVQHCYKIDMVHISMSMSTSSLIQKTITQHIDIYFDIVVWKISFKIDDTIIKIDTRKIEYK